MKSPLPQPKADAAISGAARSGQSAIVPFDFSRLDRIPNSLVRAVYNLHENFVRDVASSLSAYLRTTVTMNLVSMEQISYAEFLEGVSMPTVIIHFKMDSYFI